jgi:hypothetical protein
MLAPPIFVNHIGERNTADGPEPAHGVADRQQSIRMDAGWQAESGLSCKYSVVSVAPRPSALAASSIF